MAGTTANESGTWMLATEQGIGRREVISMGCGLTRSVRTLQPSTWSCISLRRGTGVLQTVNVTDDSCYSRHLA